MRIALVNYRYFISGGPERYMFNIKEILEENGHEVIPFSVKHKKNVATEYEKYFLDAVGKGTETYNYEYPKDFSTQLTVITRMLYSKEAKAKFRQFLYDVKPDIIYILHFQNKISCSIIDAAYEMNIPIVQRISDFGHICSNSYLYRENTGICNSCIEKGFFESVKKKCISNSYIHSAIKALSLQIMKNNKIRNKISAFVFPSSFTLSKYHDSGFNINKLFFIPTFFHPGNIVNKEEIKYKDYALFVGRIEKEKGIELLIDGFLKTSYKLKIIGFSTPEYGQHILSKIKGHENQIEFLGKMNFAEMSIYLKECLFTCVPSQWYENLPNTLLESYGFRKAVLANEIGSLPEFVNDDCGYVFKYNSLDSLIEKINFAFNNKETTKTKGLNAFNRIKNELSSDNHYNALIDLFEKTIK